MAQLYLESNIITEVMLEVVHSEIQISVIPAQRSKSRTSACVLHSWQSTLLDELLDYFAWEWLLWLHRDPHSCKWWSFLHKLKPLLVLHRPQEQVWAYLLHCRLDLTICERRDSNQDLAHRGWDVSELPCAASPEGSCNQSSLFLYTQHKKIINYTTNK